jgi:hypothetical protein
VSIPWFSTPDPPRGTAALGQLDLMLQRTAKPIELRDDELIALPRAWPSRVHDTHYLCHCCSATLRSLPPAVTWRGRDSPGSGDLDEGRVTGGDRT